MDRRTFVASLSLGGLGILADTGQLAAQARRVARIGILGNSATAGMVGPEPRLPSVAALVRGLRDLGYVYGQQYVIVPRGSDGKPELFSTLAAELIRAQVDVIVAVGIAMPALRQATSTIPIVMAASSDPVGLGYVQSLAHPGGNITGLSLQSIDTTAKRLELLKELVPTAAPIAVLWDQASLSYWHAAEGAAIARGWKLVPVEIRNANDIEGAFKAAADAHAGAILVTGAGILFPYGRRAAEVAAKVRLPAMYELRPYVEAGGLISYGADIDDVWHRAAFFVDKILKGARPGDLPIEQPTKFELVISLKTAKALGLTVPQSLLTRADELIQ